VWPAELDAASPTWDDDVPKMIEKVKVLKERERKKTEQDRADALKKAAEVPVSPSPPSFALGP
jgi:hypothetical protein